MTNKPLISYCLPVLNEEFFLPVYLESILTSPFPYELVITDGGSTDGTREILEQFHRDHPEIYVDLKWAPQSGKPYTDDWHESEIRNDLLSRCSGHYIALIDADEVVNTPDLVQIITDMAVNNKTLAQMKMVPFWGDLKHVRLSVPTDYRWFGIPLGRVIKNKTWTYNRKQHHCKLEPSTGDNALDLLLDVDYPIYHLHYGFGQAGVKPGDNRRADLLRPEDNISMYAVPDIIEDPDFSAKNWKTDVGWVIHVATEKYEGPWPSVLEKYLQCLK
jgi:glycosyltransferase involved in cell wall biosynthesis